VTKAKLKEAPKPAQDKVSLKTTTKHLSAQQASAEAESERSESRESKVQFINTLAA
jgi:hypothetical protein